MDAAISAIVPISLQTKWQALQSTLRYLDSGAPAKTAVQMYHGANPRHPLMEPMIVPLACILYVGLKPHFALLCKRLGTNGKSTFFRIFALLHNCFLFGYSLWTSISVWSLVIPFWREHGMDAVYCTKGLWNSGLQRLSFLFYLSKYWELIDTALLMIKQRTPSYLQIYHHTATLICGYMTQSSHASMNFVFVGLNTTVHAVMYGYYALTVVGIRLKIKPMITMLQIVQFMVGASMGVPMFLLRDGACANQAQKIAIAAIISHALYLLKLFVHFYRESYSAKRKIS